MMEIYGRPAAIIPEKIGIFEFCTLIYPDGTRRKEPLMQRSVMKRLAAERGIDLRLLRKGKKMQVLDLRDGYMLMPVKVRRAAPLYGYIDMDEIDCTVMDTDGTYVILLKSGVKIPIRWRIARYADFYLAALRKKNGEEK